MTTISKGSMIGDRYVLLDRIASGGMGDVWRARDHRLGREVAVKVLRGEFGHDEITRERFRFEAQAAASLTSPGVATVFDYGEEGSDDDDGGHRAYIVMELIDGESLEERVRREGSLGVRQTLDIIEQAAVALQAAHDRGLVHRDIKAANLLLRADGVVKLTDFGIARALDGSTLTQLGTVIGTVRYMSPEQLSGRPATPASDLYALGIVAYFCLTGHTPFEHQESMAIALAHVNEPVPPMPDRVPAEVAGLVAQMLAKEPSERPPSAGTVAAEMTVLKDAFVASPTRSPSVTNPNPGSHRGGTSKGHTFRTTSDDTDDLTLSDQRTTAVMVAPIATDIDDRRTRSRRHRAWYASSVLGAVLVVSAIWLGAGPDRVTIPRLQGLMATVAEARVSHLGMLADQHLADASQGAGRVISQRPRAGVSATTGSHVLLTVSSGFETIDAGSLLLQTPARASAALSSLGMRPVQTSAVSVVTPGTVVSISPNGRVRLGTTVAIGIAVPPPTPTTTTTTTTDKKAGKKHHH